MQSRWQFWMKQLYIYIVLEVFFIKQNKSFRLYATLVFDDAHWYQLIFWNENCGDRHVIV